MTKKQILQVLNDKSTYILDFKDEIHNAIELEDFNDVADAILSLYSSSLQLKEKEIITFKEFENALTKRTFENETFYETEQGLKTIEEISVIYDLYVENL